MSIEAKVLQAVATASKRKVDDVTLDSHFKQLGMDSLDLLCLVRDLEDLFDIDIEDEDLQNIETVGAIVSRLTENIGDAKSAADSSS